MNGSTKTRVLDVSEIVANSNQEERHWLLKKKNTKKKITLREVEEIIDNKSLHVLNPGRLSCFQNYQNILSTLRKNVKRFKSKSHFFFDVIKLKSILDIYEANLPNDEGV